MFVSVCGGLNSALRMLPRSHTVLWLKYSGPAAAVGTGVMFTHVDTASGRVFSPTKRSQRHPEVQGTVSTDYFCVQISC